MQLLDHPLQPVEPTGVLRSSSVPSVSDAFGVHQLNVNGGTASGEVAWTNCDGSVAALGLPNSGGADGQPFTVHASLQVTPVRFRGTSAPRISLALPRLAKVKRRLPVLRFNVRSSGRGTLQVLLKDHYVRGSYRLEISMAKLPNML